MALHPCPECGHPVSPRARACPHCGAPVSHAVRTMVAGLILLTLAVVGLMLAMALTQTRPWQTRAYGQPPGSGPDLARTATPGQRSVEPASFALPLRPGSGTQGPLSARPVSPPGSASVHAPAVSSSSAPAAR